ncbi:MAG TPA: NAD(P)/FAD-dependent oxidoreductase [Candidatus Bathyarchaeia archaeon]|nr:NAD(P)/FAD-dependent oxidoreductase [Candidatus Bathyarchaeia archaeon]
MSGRDYDAIIVGASFAGLAVARGLSGRVLLLDRNEVGAVQTSACGTPLWVPQALGVAHSVLQVHDKLTVRGPSRTVTYDLSAVPFCTFDYKRFCHGLLEQTRARFLRASVTGVEDGAVLTSDGRFTAPIIVDCSGWRGALVNDGAPASPVAAGHFSFGLETRTDLSDEGLSFWLDGSLIPRGLGWIFPVGKGSLIGLGSYVGLSKLKPALERFLHDRGAVPTTYHGTYFPHRLLRPTVGRLFAVGDAAGQCLPLTAEGIRPALYFGVECGRIVQQILEGRLGLTEGLERYKSLVERHRHAYRVLRVAQWVAEHAPTRWFVALTGLAGRRPVLPRWWPRYGWFGRFDPDPAAAV